MDLQRLDPADRQALAELHELQLRRWGTDAPHDPPPDAQETVADATHSWSPSEVETWLVRDDRCLGFTTLTFFTADNTHLVDVDLAVDPAVRRQGLGSQLFHHAVQRGRAAGRRALIGELRMESDGERFVRARGAAIACVDARRRLALDMLDPARLARLHEQAREAAAGYDVLQWTGPVAEDLVDGLAAALRSINDAPTDDLDWDDEDWDAMRLRWMEDHRARSGHRWHTAAARHRDTGQVAGLTELVVRENGSSWLAYQEATTVDPAHRGHRLGLLLKLELLDRLRRLEPSVRAVDTWNAASNRHMIAVNEAMGYSVLDSTAEWQAPLNAPAG
jgi:GNAT superfamily N-acetyltransferase